MIRIPRRTIDHSKHGQPCSNNQSTGDLYQPIYKQYGNIQRIPYINEVLSTVSDALVKLNDINSLAELKVLNL